MEGKSPFSLNNFPWMSASGWQFHLAVWGARAGPPRRVLDPSRRADGRPVFVHWSTGCCPSRKLRPSGNTRTYDMAKQSLVCS